MAQLLVRDLEEEIKRRLKRRAKQRGRSMEEEARDILRNALKGEDSVRPPAGLGTRISKRFRQIGLDADIPELRGYPAEPPKLRE